MFPSFSAGLGVWTRKQPGPYLGSSCRWAAEICWFELQNMVRMTVFSSKCFLASSAQQNP